MLNIQLLVFIASIAFISAQGEIPSGGSTVPSLISSTVITSSSTTPATASTPKSSERTTTQAPVVPPQVPTWTVKSSNSTCVMLRGNFTFAVTYTTATGNSVSDRVDIPKTAKASGNCGPYVSSLVLNWSQGNLTFVFIKKPIYDAGLDTGNGSYSLTTIFGQITVVNSNDQNGTSNGKDGGDSTPSSASSGQVFYIAVRQPDYMTTALHNSYTCESYQSIIADRTGTAYLEMRNVQLEAFHDSPTGDFSPSQPCTADTMSSVEAILGYTALAALVLAALGYLAWKKFGRAGYTEV